MYFFSKTLVNPTYVWYNTGTSWGLCKMNNIDFLKIEKITNYISNNFKDENNYQNNVNLLKFIKKENIVLNGEEMIYLINSNASFKLTIKELIESGKISKLNDVKFVKLAIKSIRFLDAMDTEEREEEILDDTNLNLVNLGETYFEEAIQQYIKQLPQKILTYKETIELFKRYENGDNEAFDQLIYYNLRLSVAIAKKFLNSGVDILDLIQAGNEGLIKAVNRYNYRMGVKFSTYATYWLRQYISRSIDNESRIIRIPVNVSQDIVKVRKVLSYYYNECGIEPTIEQISLETKLSPSSIQDALENMDDAISYNNKVNNDGDSCDEVELIDLISDDYKSVNYTEDKIFNSQVRTALSNIQNLTLNERKVIYYRFGFKDGVTYTLESTGNILGITRERVRQIEKNAIKKLKISSEFQKLCQDETYRERRHGLHR